MRLVKILLHTQLKQTNLENRLAISMESTEEGFNDTVFKHFLDELKHCNPDMRIHIQLVPIFLYSCLIYLVMLPFRLIKTMFFIKMCFALFLFCGNLEYFSPL